MIVSGRRRLLVAAAAILAAPCPVAAQEVRYRVAMVFTTTPPALMQGPQPEHPGARAFLETLQASGYTLGGNLVFEPRSAEGHYERYAEIFAELLRLKVDVIVTVGEHMTKFAKRATSTVPIVMAYSNYPVQEGLVQSLARPGGNVTGVSYSPTTELEAKRLELLKEAVPAITRVAFLGLRSEWDSPNGRSVRAAADRSSLTLSLAEATPSDYNPAFAAMSRDRPDALFVANSPVNFGYRDAIVRYALSARLPGTYPVKQYVSAGGLMSYGINLPDQFRRTALIVVKLLKGMNAADLPIEQPTQFELVINLATARSLGLSLSPALLQRADELLQ